MFAALGLAMVATALIGQSPKPGTTAPGPAGAPAVAAPAPAPKPDPPPDPVPPGSGRPLVPWDLSVEVAGHHVYGFYDPQARTAFTVLPWGVLGADQDGRPDVTESADDPRTVLCRFLAYPDGFQRLVAAHLRVLLGGQGANYVAKYFVGESLTEAHVVPMALSSVRVDFVRSARPEAAWHLPNPDGAEIVFGRDFTARLRFATPAEAAKARASIEARTADLHLTLGFNGTAARTRTVALQTDFVKAGDFSLDSGPGRGIDADDQFYSVADVGRIFGRFRDRYHLEVLGYPAPPAFALALVERFRDHVFQAVAVDLDQAEEKLRGYEGSFVGKQPFRPDLIRKDAEKAIDEFGESVSATRDRLDKGKETRADTEATKDAALAKLRDAYKKAVSRSGGLGGSGPGYGGNLSLGLSDSEEKELVNEVSKAVDTYQASQNAHEFEQTLRLLLAAVLNKKGSTEYTVEGERLVPKRVNLYRVNREALDRQTAFGFDQVTLTEAARAVRLIVSPEAVADDVVRKAPAPATTIERLDTALKPIREDLGRAGEKIVRAEARFDDRVGRLEHDLLDRLARVETETGQRITALEARLGQYKALMAEGAYLRTVDVTFYCRPGEKPKPVFVPVAADPASGAPAPTFLGADIECLTNDTGEGISEQKVTPARKDGRFGVFVSVTPARVRMRDSKVTVKLFVFSKGGPLAVGAPEPAN
jgi:hypothetical protein